MNKFEQLEQQHIGIKAVISETKSLLNTLEDNASQKAVAKNISQLAGQLKIHLSHEDRFLYPSLLKSDDKTLQVKTNQYIKEMGGLSEIYSDFKVKYNTVPKIQDNVTVAKREIKEVLNAVEKRIFKEDSDLYMIAKNVI